MSLIYLSLLDLHIVGTSRKHISMLAIFGHNPFPIFITVGCEGLLSWFFIAMLKIWLRASTRLFDTGMNGIVSAVSLKKINCRQPG